MIEFSSGRERTVNYINICNTIADSYPQGTPHGVQKDAIQNSFDAQLGSRMVTVRFALVETVQGRFFTITDSNTTGLTGPILTERRQYEEDLPAEYNWARFESFAFTKRDLDAIGARGQGKFIFLHASRTHTMLYDSLLEDGIYRLGATRAEATGSPIITPWEGDEARKQLAQHTGLSPLGDVGTRVILEEPSDELVEYFKDGDFERAIQETWFRLLEKKRLKVILEDGDTSHSVAVPEPYPLPSADGADCKVWRLGSDFDDNTLTLTTNETFRIKHFHAVYFSSRKIPEDLQGIAVIHNGMKVATLPMSVAPPQVRERTTGFIEFDRELDRQLRKGRNQHPNHYDLKWRRRIPRAIKTYVNEQLKAFGRKKLGLGVDPRELRRRHRTNAEDWAMRQLQRFAKDLDLFGAKGGRANPSNGNETRPKLIGVRISNFSFPDPSIAPRVNWGDEIEDVKLVCYNRTERKLDLSVVLSVLYHDTETFCLLDHEPVNLASHKTKDLGEFSISFSKERFAESGEYRLKASMFDSTTGDRIDSVVRRFWVESSPPLRKPFELEPVDGFPEPYDRRQWLTEGGINSSPKLLYNTRHPAYAAAEEDEQDLSEHLLQVMLEGALQFVVRRPDRDDGRPDFHPLRTERIISPTQERAAIPDTAYDEITRYLADVRWRMHE